MRNNTSVLAVLHDKHVQILNVADRKVPETRGGDVLRGAVAAITLVGHCLHSLVAATNWRVHTTGLAPAGAQLWEHLIAMTSEALCALLHNALHDDRLDHLLVLCRRNNNKNAHTVCILVNANVKVIERKKGRSCEEVSAQKKRQYHLRALLTVEQHVETYIL